VYKHECTMDQELTSNKWWTDVNDIAEAILNV